MVGWVQLQTGNDRTLGIRDFNRVHEITWSPAGMGLYCCQLHSHQLASEFPLQHFHQVVIKPELEQPSWQDTLMLQERPFYLQTVLFYLQKVLTGGAVLLTLSLNTPLLQLPVVRWSSTFTWIMFLPVPRARCLITWTPGSVRMQIRLTTLCLWTQLWGHVELQGGICFVHLWILSICVIMDTEDTW